MFSQSVIEKLDFYVYFLQDPRTDEVFYIGKGIGNRVFNHLECAIETDGTTEKLDKIRDIVDSGNKVKHFILRHGLSESIAFEIEASLIDFVGMKNLSNLQGGHYSSDYGLKTASEISAIYEASELSTDKPILLININKRYHRDMTDNELYDATRKSWVVGTRRNNAKYGIATYRGLTREVYEIDNWYSIEVNGKTRWGFNGKKANENIREKLRYKAIGSFFTKGAANPIKYLNC
jgi:hypothetical protein